MKNRQKINYEDIVEMGISLIKDDTDYIYECSDDKIKAGIAYRISGIVDFIRALDEATVLSEPDVCENPDTSISKQPKFKEGVITVSDEDWVNYLNSGLKGN